VVGRSVVLSRCNVVLVSLTLTSGDVMARSDDVIMTFHKSKFSFPCSEFRVKHTQRYYANSRGHAVI